MILLLVAFFLSTVVTFAVIRSARRHAHLSGDADFSGPQKFHARAVPRIGGVGIVAGVGVALVGLWLVRGREALLGPLLLVSALPAFVGGFAEDLTKAQSPRRRLILTALSAALAIWLLGGVLSRTDIPGLDWIVTFGLGAVLLTVLCVTGISQAVNIIDGFNGLAAMCVMLMLGALAYVAYQTQDPLIAVCALAGIGAVAGFFVWNYPSGHIFLGDGGAYFLGFYYAELAVMLVHRNPDVSPLCPLLIAVYPVFETLFSIYRKKVLRGMSPGVPDGVHLHMLVYKRLMRWGLGARDARAMTRRNSMTSPYLWVLCMLSVVPATLFWSRPGWLAAFIGLFAATYVLLYWSIVRFRVPGWLIVRS